MTRFKIMARAGVGIILIPLVGCAIDQGDYAKKMIANMDARPPDQRVPNWDTTRALMLRKAPKVGDQAPDFTLKTRDGTDSIRLSDFESKKPVVLIFGSWT